MLIKYFAYYRDITGRRDEELPAPALLGDLFRSLVERYGADMHAKLLSPDCQSLGPDAIILINGRNIAYTGMLDTPLKDTDVLAVFPIVAGG